MPEKTLATDNQTDNQSGPPGNAPVVEQRSKFRGVTVLLMAAVAIIAAGAAYHFRVLDRFVTAQSKPSTNEELTPTLGALSQDNSLSSSKLLGELGRSPADPSRVLFSAFEKSVGADGDKKPKSCPPGSVVQSASESAPADSGAALHEAPPLGSAGAPVETGKAVGTPVITGRAPGDSPPQEKGRKKKKIAELGTQEAEKTAPAGEIAAADTPAPPDSSAAVKAQEQRPVETPRPAPAVASKPRESADQGKSEQFQLPGSLVVKIPGYAGTMAKWGLLVVLDDSEAMARKSRAWQPNRVQAGVDFVGRLSDALPPSSRLAVRDFMCSRTDGGKKQPVGQCPSHMLYDWGDTPFKGLKDRLQSLQPGGHTDPCAAAAFALKKDLAGTKNVTPRLLIVTNGVGKCSAKELLHALDDKSGRDHTLVDVLAVGMPKKRLATYAAIARKGNGLLLKVDRPGDVEQVLARYGKALKTKAREKLEVRSDKTVFTSALEEELTLPPGSYTVTLPPVAGLEPARRVIPNVKVGSGEAKVLDVPLKKARPAGRAGKK